MILKNGLHPSVPSSYSWLWAPELFLIGLKGYYAGPMVRLGLATCKPSILTPLLPLQLKSHCFKNKPALSELRANCRNSSKYLMHWMCVCISADRAGGSFQWHPRDRRKSVGESPLQAQEERQRAPRIIAPTGYKIKFRAGVRGGLGSQVGGEVSAGWC